jgi:hypothetical protein
MESHALYYKYSIDCTKNRQENKKTGKKVVLYVPDTFDPEVHLPEELRHLADYARYLLHRINVGRVHLRRGNCLVYLKRDYLVEFIPKERFTAIRDALVDSGVIHVRKFCVKGEISFGYRLLYPHNQGFSLYQPTTERLIDKIMRWRKQESDTLRHPVHRELRHFVKALTIDELAALASVHGTPFQQSAQVVMIHRITEGDFFSIPDRHGRFHSNITNLKKTLRPFLRYRESKLVNLDIANFQPMIFCLLLVNLLSNSGKLDNLIDYEFSDSSNAYALDIDEAFLSSLSGFSSPDSLVSLSYSFSPEYQETGGIEGEREGEGEILPILRRFCIEKRCIVNSDNDLQQANNSQRNQEEEGEGEEEGEALPILRRFCIEKRSIVNNDNTLRQANNSQRNEEEGEGGSRNSPLLHANRFNNNHNTQQDNNLQQVNNRQSLPPDVIEFIGLCEQGVLYDNLMERLGIPARRRKGFKRLFFSQVFFGRVKATGRVRELFARDFPTVYKAINDLKRKDYRQLAYLLQTHESKIMIDVICRKILDELPGTFIATIHDSIMTTPDKADEVREIMLREFRRFGLNPTIRLEV